MTERDYSEICKNVLLIVRQASDFISGEFGKVQLQDIEAKEKNSLVSYVDKTAEEILVEGLEKLLPEAAFLTEEETTAQKNGNIRWIIDPLDGTTNFLHNIPHFSVSVSLEVNNELVIGIVEEINRKEAYYAWKSGGAFMNGDPIRVKNNSKISDAVLATGFPYIIDDASPILNTLEYWIHNTRGIRRNGSAALDLAYVARGIFDFYYETTLNAWDVAGGTVIVREAGGKVSDFAGSDNFINNGRLLASNGLLHNDILNVLMKKHN